MQTTSQKITRKQVNDIIRNEDQGGSVRLAVMQGVGYEWHLYLNYAPSTEPLSLVAFIVPEGPSSVLRGPFEGFTIYYNDEEIAEAQKFAYDKIVADIMQSITDNI